MSIWDTEHNNGLRIWLLLGDHDMEIIADPGLHSKPGHEARESICRNQPKLHRERRYEKLQPVKPALQKLKHLLLAPIVWLAAAVFLVEEAIWDWTAALMARFGAARAIHAIERHIASLRPRWALFAFLLPSVTIIPAKFFGLLAISAGHWLLGSSIFLFAKIVGVALFSRIFNLTRPALMQLGWFARFYAWVMFYRNRIHEYLDHWQTYQRIKQRLHSMIAAFKAKLAALFSATGK